ncbi:hypothetical protein HUG17_8104 [Dermatophagoides farinae]|uniref:WH1 domain-containing protein n=1 Tax=Dermatophagoides farinae TaxID=6954 RepID=A0A9D4NWN2_DERFA|nr:uncharacterized protein LOC124495499 [Dermatophagoides farinae]KAH7640635.1 hypothetical protein HUG17_8104 [Dermatophagoides farinae]
MMAYRGRTLPPAPPPPPPSSSQSRLSKISSNRYSQQYYSTTDSTSSSDNNNHNQNSIRSRSISNISRLSNSNHSTDSAPSRSSSISNSSANMDNDSNGTTPPHSLSPTTTSRLLDEFEQSKIEMFYRSHRTFVYVGQCLVTLLFTETELVDGGRQSRPKSKDWKQICHGVPVLLFNRGDTRSRDKRQIQICIAEHGTGFQLWTDIIDNLSNYHALKPTFHTMYLSMDHRKMAGFQFENQFAALEFFRQIEIITANPLNISLTGPKAGKKSGEKFRIFRKQRSKSVGRSNDIHHHHHHNVSNESSPFYDLHDQSKNNHSKNKRPPGKTDISTPCLFQHVTSVNLHNFNQFDSTITGQNGDENSNATTESDFNQKFENYSTRIRSDYSTPFPYHHHHHHHHHHHNHRSTTTSSTSA